MALYLLARIVFTEEAENHSGLYKDGFMSESTGRFSNFPKNVGAENYPELLHPVHGNDKILHINVCLVKIRSKLSSNTLLRLLRNFIRQTKYVMVASYHSGWFIEANPR